MAYDPELAERLRHALASEPAVTERKMFGGLAFLVRGHMTAVASGKSGLMIRADPTTTGDLVETTPANFAQMSGRQMTGWLHLDAEDIRSDQDLATWIDRALSYSATLRPKA
jgi:TfoX/Sxy family transcriptional regulator of competence genes